MKKTRLNHAIRYAILSSFLSLNVTPTAFAENNQNQTAIIQEQTDTNLGFEFIKTQINKSPNDKAIYQGIKLDNGIKKLPRNQ